MMSSNVHYPLFNDIISFMIKHQATNHRFNP